MKCSDVSSLLVDFLYEEMPPAKRRDFLAHVEGCASCSAEVKAMSSTLGHARAALRGPLAEEPPPGVRARILQAAEAAAAAVAPDSAKPRVSRAPEPEGFFARLWKTPWLVPALGAASVATAVFLVKVIKNPQVIPEQKPAVTEALTQPAAEPQGIQQAQPRPETERGPTAAPSTPAPAEPGLAGLAKKPTARRGRDSRAEPKSAAAAGKPRAALPDRDGPVTSRRHFSNDPLAGVQWEEQAQAPVGEATTGKGGGGTAAPRKAPAAAIAKQEPTPGTPVEKDETIRDHAQRSLAEGESGAFGAAAGSSDRWAEPPPPRPAEAPVAAAPSPPPRAVGAPADFATAPVAAAPPPSQKAGRIQAFEDQLDSAPPQPARSDERAKNRAPSRPPAAIPAAQAEAPADKKKASESKDTISLEERVRKAEKLFAEKKWAEAAAAFRALLAQAPSNPAAKTWRERVAAAELAQEQDRTLKAKKAVEKDPLDGL